jgi:hypothetical protein
VVNRFLRRSGSRVSLLNACRPTQVSMTPGLREIPMPSRITQKSTRPRGSDRSMCCHQATTIACQFQDRIDVLATRHAAEMELCRICANRGQKTETRAPLRAKGAGSEEPTYHSSRGRRMSLTFPSYRSGVGVEKLFLAKSAKNKIASRCLISDPLGSQDIFYPSRFSCFGRKPSFSTPTGVCAH